MPNITTFDTNAPYIYLTVSVAADNQTIQEFDAIFDTGAPWTEFSDTALHYAGFLTAIKPAVLQNGLQTQKHGKIVLPQRSAGDDEDRRPDRSVAATGSCPRHPASSWTVEDCATSASSVRRAKAAATTGPTQRDRGP